MGSRILSRSFNVEPWHSTTADAKNDDNDFEEGAADSPQNSDLPEQSDDEEEDPTCISMVPMADMLNARFRTENVSGSIYTDSPILNFDVIPVQTILRRKLS